MQGLGRGEDVRVKREHTGHMVNTNSQVALFAAIHDELLDHRWSNLKWLWELRELMDKLQFNRFVNLGELLEQPRENDLL